MVYIIHTNHFPHGVGRGGYGTMHQGVHSPLSTSHPTNTLHQRAHSSPRRGLSERCHGWSIERDRGGNV